MKKNKNDYDLDFVILMTVALTCAAVGFGTWFLCMLAGIWPY